MKGEQKYFIGLMSGTSLDGIDAALTNATCSKIIARHEQPLPDTLRKALSELHQTPLTDLNQLMQIDQQLGALYADAVNTLIHTSEIDRETVIAIGCHGQTVRHEPDLPHPFSLQIGNAATLAEKTGICVVYDFRSGDIAAGGQGAPLAPGYHDAQFRSNDSHRVIINIGGIANLTNLQPGCPTEGHDTGPGNALMDSWCQRQQQQPFDQRGGWGGSFQPSVQLLERLLETAYFSRPAPKSTGRELFNLGWLEPYLSGLDITPGEIQATLCELTAVSIANAVSELNHTPHQAFICGGGAKNDHLMTRLRHHLPRATSLETTEALGIDPAWVEAAAFAWLAMRRLQELPGNLPTVTGANRAVRLGAVTHA